jgi:hypothetical protein
MSDDKINFVQVTGQRDAVQLGLDEQRAAFAEQFRRWMEKAYIP